MLATKMSTAIINTPRERRIEAIDVLSRSFMHYPLMRYFFSDQGANYQRALQALFRFSCERRLAVNWPLLGSVSATRLMGVAGVSLPEDVPWPASLERAYRLFRLVIGPDAYARFERYAELCDRHSPSQPHLTLGVLGVRPEMQGGGYGRALLNAVHALTEAHPTATGVYLDTHTTANVTLYARFGYELVAHEQLADLDMWFLFRPNGR